VRLAAATDIAGGESERVLDQARLNARPQTGFQNPIDAALLAGAPAETASARRLDEIPYDFRRQRLSVLVAEDGRSVLTPRARSPASRPPQRGPSLRTARSSPPPSFAIASSNASPI
jgi:hypothetical protein